MRPVAKVVAWFACARVCLCVGLLDTLVSPAKTVKLIGVSFRVGTVGGPYVGKEPRIGRGLRSPPETGTFWVDEPHDSITAAILSSLLHPIIRII